VALPSLDTIGLQVTVMLGRTRMPIHKLLRLGRGAVIELATEDNDEVEILANDLLIAKGQVVVSSNRIQVEVTSLVGSPAPHGPAAQPG
jgi:flagellar motor switch protein FliN